MSYAIAAALQTAVYFRLGADAPIAAFVGDAIFDTQPSGPVPGLFILIGPEKVKDRSDQTGRGADHEFVVSVVSDAPGFAKAKQAAAAVSDALVDADLSLGRGRLVSLNFARARALRVGTGTGRRIDLTFRARVDDV